jgi:hypothetical protein
MKEKKPIAREYALRYQKSSKKGKNRILNEFIELTGYNRCYASYLLKNHNRKVYISNKIAVIGDINKTIRKRRPKLYDEKILKFLKKIWAICDFICGKRLAPILPEIISKLEKFNELKLSDEVSKKLCTISPATIDRLLKNEKKKLTLKGKSHTKPGTLLKSQIPVRTFADWNDKRPGFLEIDLVGHDGGNVSGDFGYTLDTTDVATGWTEFQAVKNRAAKWTNEALNTIKGQLPFDLLGIDSDNDSAFINDHLLRYCKDNRITFTRTRSNKKNDNCYIEQKNWSVVRRAVGYYRYDTEEELKFLNKLYNNLRLYNNYFMPSMKLLEKVRVGSKIIKKFDKAMTPYKRILLSEHISEANKEKLRTEYEDLNPVEIKRKMIKIQEQLQTIIKRKIYEK